MYIISDTNLHEGKYRKCCKKCVFYIKNTFIYHKNDDFHHFCHFCNLIIVFFRLRSYNDDRNGQNFEHGGLKMVKMMILVVVEMMIYYR